MAEHKLRRIIHETDSVGQPTATYILSSSIQDGTKDSHGRIQQTMRLDIVPNSIAQTSRNADDSSYPTKNTVSIFRSYVTSLTTYLATLFLPTGYPHTVSPDYTPYQIYDSLQAFASSIAGLLSSRAVLQSLNLTSSSSDTETATYATLLSIAQATIANLSTILFAQYAAPRISTEVKFYRFLADIVNDLAFVLDCLSPSLPPTVKFSPGIVLALPLPAVTLPVRILTLCLSSALRAICGVAGGSSKAVLSAHFAKDDPSSIGELNAKDGSQETVVNLVGMWVGGLLVSRVDGLKATWAWMLALLAMHLFFNYRAVRSVRLRGLNKTRAAMVFGQLLRKQDEGARQADSITVEEVGKRENILFGRRDVLMLDERGATLGFYTNSSSFSDFARCVRQQSQAHSGALVDSRGNGALAALFDCFEHENYLLWFDPKTFQATVMLKKEATSSDQLKSHCHGAKMAQICRDRSAKDQNLEQALSESLEWVDTNWDSCCSDLAKAGWNLRLTSLENPSARRIDIQ